MKYAEDVSNCYSKSKPQGVKNAIEAAYDDGLGDVLKNVLKLISEGMVRYNTADLITKHLNTLGVLSDLAMYIKQYSSEQNAMLISDTNMLLNRIIEDSDTPFVYERTGINVDHFMIDEFQDTSVMQWKNFRPLVKESLDYGKENMLVGDVKQSIYRWRNSDWKLLQEQVNKDFLSGQLENKILETNWRSDENIIGFNNDFFQKASQLIQLKFNESVEPLQAVYPVLNELTGKISGAYRDVHQQISPKAGAGYVKVEFIPQDENEAGWMQSSLERIPKLIENLVDRGYRLSDIAFLVRKNKEAVILTNYLFTYKNSPEARKDISYNVIGNEGILLTSSLSVEFLAAVLSVLENPENDIERAIMNYGYLRGKQKKTDEEAMKIIFDGCPGKF
ncbi:MAG: UvrD-helicase domain-containing protein [Paludibacteraceae bacterium]